MPTSRPAAGTATLNTGNVLAAALKGYWLVDANANNPNLTATSQPTLVRTGSPTYATTGVLGGHFVGATSGVVETSHPISPAIGILPFMFGAVFATVSTKTAASGVDYIACLGDSTNTSGVIYSLLLIDDGTYATAGDLVLIKRTTAGGGQATYVFGRVDDGLIHAVNVTCTVHTIGASSDIRVSLDGTTTTNIEAASPVFSTGDTWDYMSLLAWSDAAGTPRAGSSTNLLGAAVWYSDAAVSDSDSNAATADPWVMLSGSGGAATAVTFGSHPTSGAVNAASTNITIGVDTTPITGTLVVTPATSVGSGGTFSPTTVSLTTGSPSATVTFTPSKSGVHTISSTNNGGLSNPSTYTYTVAPEVTVTLVASPTDGTTQNSLSSLHWAQWDTTDIGTVGAPTNKGTTETTSGAGVITIPLPNSSLTNGQNALVVVLNSAGTSIAGGIAPVT